MSQWTAVDIPDLTGRVVIVTGANRGLGYAAAKWMAGRGATVVMGVRRVESGEAAAEQIRQGAPDVTLDVLQLDLADLDSVRGFAEAFRTRYERLDVLMNSAGIMAVPEGKTADGFERQFGVNHLGHFALTGLLVDVLTNTAGSRVVNVSSLAANSGEMNWDDLHYENDYDRFSVYRQSKLANLLFTLGLQRRFETAGAPTIAVAAHPGLSATDLQDGMEIHIPIVLPILLAGFKLFAMDAAQGTLSQVRAAVAPDVTGGDYYGPRFRTRGNPILVDMPEQATQADADRLWERSEALTGVRFGLEKA